MVSIYVYWALGGHSIHCNWFLVHTASLHVAKAVCVPLDPRPSTLAEAGSRLLDSHLGFLDAIKINIAIIYMLLFSNDLA